MEKKKLYCDLHTHSTRSDGALSRAEVIEEAIKKRYWYPCYHRP